MKGEDYCKILGNVKMDLSNYHGNDMYSDGDIEDVILNIVQSEEDYDTSINNSNRFEIFYHLSKEREMITLPMNIMAQDTVLEIGSGCGAITGALAKKAKQVECIELSKRRSMINAYRNKKFNNITIHVGNYEDISLTEKYDIITLIGVLEYAGYYIHADNPYESFLRNVKGKLKNNGKLFVAIENRLGMKYLSGCKEDHYGREFIGIEGYPLKNGIKTFSYHGLVELFHRVGFCDYTFYYPYPDYKFPHVIYSDNYLPDKGNLKEVGTNYSSSRIQIFDEKKAFNSLIMKEEFKLFSNSFLVELRNGD